jgi:hypothetical protein
MLTYTCNCMYGERDPRCCIARARRAELEEAHRLGREGKPLPERQSAPSIAEANVIRDDIARINAVRM